MPDDAIERWFLSPEERGNPATEIDRRRGNGLAYTTGNHVAILVHGRPYFEQLHRALCALQAGDSVHLTDWRGDPDQHLIDDVELADVLVTLAERGVKIRGLVWLLHPKVSGFHMEHHVELAKRVNGAGGLLLLDQRVRPAGSHHQKLVLLRHASPDREDLAFVGGIDLCHGRRDDERHLVSGTHLIELASAQYGLDYRFGFAGRAICRLDGVGVDGDDCFGAYPDYWGYLHGDGSGGWVWATGSAADHVVDDGDVEGWSWGAGDSGATHPAPPALSIDDVCDQVASPTPSPSPQSPSPSPSTGDGNGGGGTDDGANSGTVGLSPPPSASGPSPRTNSASGSPTAPAGTSPAAAAPSSPAPDVVRAAAAAPPAPDGPPIGGLVTVGAIALLGLAGWFRLRRRKDGA